MRTIKTITTILATLALMMGLMSGAQAQPIQPTTQAHITSAKAKAKAPAKLHIKGASNLASEWAGWNTLDYVFNKSPKTMRTLTNKTDSVAYVGTSTKPISKLPLVSFRGRDAYNRMTNHVFVFTASKNIKKGKQMIPAYQFNRLAKALPTCKRESSLNCYWNAKKKGNKKGTSFISLDSAVGTLYKGK